MVSLAFCFQLYSILARINIRKYFSFPLLVEMLFCIKKWSILESILVEINVYCDFFLIECPVIVKYIHPMMPSNSNVLLLIFFPTWPVNWSEVIKVTLYYCVGNLYLFIKQYSMKLGAPVFDACIFKIVTLSWWIVALTRINWPTSSLLTLSKPIFVR